MPAWLGSSQSLFWVTDCNFSLCPHLVAKARKLCLASFTKPRTPGLHLQDLSTSQRPHLLTSSLWGLSFNIRIGGPVHRGSVQHSHSINSIMACLKYSWIQDSGRTYYYTCLGPVFLNPRKCPYLVRFYGAYWSLRPRGEQRGDARSCLTSHPEDSLLSLKALIVP